MRTLLMRGVVRRACEKITCVEPWPCIIHDRPGATLTEKPVCKCGYYECACREKLVAANPVESKKKPRPRKVKGPRASKEAAIAKKKLQDRLNNGEVFIPRGDPVEQLKREQAKPGQFGTPTGGGIGVMSTPNPAAQREFLSAPLQDVPDLVFKREYLCAPMPASHEELDELAGVRQPTAVGLPEVGDIVSATLEPRAGKHLVREVRGNLVFTEGQFECISMEHLEIIHRGPRLGDQIEAQWDKILWTVVGLEVTNQLWVTLINGLVEYPKVLPWGRRRGCQKNGFRTGDLVRFDTMETPDYPRVIKTFMSGDTLMVEAETKGTTGVPSMFYRSPARETHLVQANAAPRALGKPTL